MPALKLIEQLSGLGDLYEDGNSLGQVRYELEVYREMLDAIGEQIEGLGRIHARIHEDALLKFWPLFEKRAQLTLHVEDGRKFDCLLTDAKGTLVGRGKGLYR